MLSSKLPLVLTLVLAGPGSLLLSVVAVGQTFSLEVRAPVLYPGSDLNATLLTAASTAALDSLSKQYGIPLATTSGSGKIHRFMFSSTIKPDPISASQSSIIGNFTEVNLVVLVDEATQREVVRTENHPKNLAALSTNAPVLIAYYRKLYAEGFKWLAAHQQNSN